jgi:hypothetical protein
MTFWSDAGFNHCMWCRESDDLWSDPQIVEKLILSAAVIVRYLVKGTFLLL